MKLTHRMSLLGSIACAGLASAQSSVTLYGTIDINARYVKADGQSRYLSESTDGINSSQLGFRGIEDLGGGLKAGFTLLSGVNADSGTANAKFWNRRSTLSLYGNWGELRMGRDYTPTFWSQGLFDAMGFNGLGNSVYVRQLYGGTRKDNAVQYFLPGDLGGFYGWAMAAPSEGGTSADLLGRYIGARAGFGTSALDIAVAWSETRLDTVAGHPQQKTYNVGASYDFKIFKLTGYYDRETLLAKIENMGSAGVVVPVGLSEIRLSYDRSHLKNPPGPSSTVDSIEATYQYNLSKRTATYATASRLSNKNATRLTLPSAAGPTTPGGKSQGFELGVRHFF